MKKLTFQEIKKLPPGAMFWAFDGNMYVPFVFVKDYPPSPDVIICTESSNDCSNTVIFLISQNQDATAYRAKMSSDFIKFMHDSLHNADDEKHPYLIYSNTAPYPDWLEELKKEYHRNQTEI